MAAIIFFTLLISMSFLILPSGSAEEQEQSPEDRQILEHLTQAKHYRQEARELQQTIERYRIMRDMYEKGSEERLHGFNQLGRQRMVKRIERIIQYFTQTKLEMEQLAAEHEAIAKALRTSNKRQ